MYTSRNIFQEKKKLKQSCISLDLSMSNQTDSFAVSIISFLEYYQK